MSSESLSEHFNFFKVHLKRLPGKQSGTFKYFADGRTYHLDGRYSATILRCAHRNARGFSCSAIIYLHSPDDIEGQDVEVTNSHNELCPLDNLLMLREQFIEELCAKAKSNWEELKLNYDEVKRQPK